MCSRNITLGRQTKYAGEISHDTHAAKLGWTRNIRNNTPKAAKSHMRQTKGVGEIGCTRNITEDRQGCIGLTKYHKDTLRCASKTRHRMQLKYNKVLGNSIFTTPAGNVVWKAIFLVKFKNQNMTNGEAALAFSLLSKRTGIKPKLCI